MNNFYTKIANEVVLAEVLALQNLAKNLPNDFDSLVEYILSFQGKVVVTGIGKSGYIANKLAASFASTGTTSCYIHPAEAGHGDLGMITEKDLVIMLSTSGESTELFHIIEYCKRLGIKIAGMTMDPTSTVAINSNFLLLLPKTEEVSDIGAPTTSTLMMLSLGDALCTAIHKGKNFSREEFKIYHPGGKIGIKLLKVSDIMHKELELPVVFAHTSFTDTILTITVKGFGCAIVVDENIKIRGIITDGDLRRHLNDDILTKKASDVMTLNPTSIDQQKLAVEALLLMNNHSITVLPVTANDNRLVGLLHIHDLLRVGIK